MASFFESQGFRGVDQNKQRWKWKEEDPDMGQTLQQGSSQARYLFSTITYYSVIRAFIWYLIYSISKEIINVLSDKPGTYRSCFNLIIK